MDIKEYHLEIGLIIIMLLFFSWFLIRGNESIIKKNERTFCAENFPREDIYWSAKVDANSTHCAYLDFYNKNENLDYNKYIYIINEERKLELIKIELKHIGVD